MIRAPAILLRIVICGSPRPFITGWNRNCSAAKGMASGSIHVALVRVSALVKPWEFPYEAKYGGCRSWVTLPDPPGMRVIRVETAAEMAAAVAKSLPADAAVMAAASAPVEVAPSKAQSNPEALTQLQSWYNKADAETRKAFQIWVIQQQ